MTRLLLLVALAAGAASADVGPSRADAAARRRGETLEVRGFIGVSLIGRSQVWTRER